MEKETPVNLPEGSRKYLINLLDTKKEAAGGIKLQEASAACINLYATNEKTDEMRG